MQDENSKNANKLRMEHTKGANERCTEWKEGTGMNADLEWGLFALV